MNTDKIIRNIKEGKEVQAFKSLYTLYPKVEKFISINSGSKAEAEDIFQEALIILYKKVNDQNSEIKLEGFLMNTCKLLWSNELRKKKVRQKSGEEGLINLQYQDEIEEQIEKEEKLNKIETIFHQLGTKCKEILELFYYQNLSMEKIAKRFGYKAIQSAKAKKYRCMEHARSLALKMTNLKK